MQSLNEHSKPGSSTWFPSDHFRASLSVYLVLALLGVCISAPLRCQNIKVVKGTVFDNRTNTVLTGVRIAQKGSFQLVLSGTRGEFRIEAERESTLVFSLEGYQSQEIVVTRGPKHSVLAVRLQPVPSNYNQPNVVFILADDLGWVQTEPFGSDYYETPNVLRLAREGIRFTQAYAAAPVCSPTRASIMTGKYPARLHLTDFIPGLKSDDEPLKVPDWQKYLPLEEYTLGELFKENGYETAIFGKWHLSVAKRPPESLPFNPHQQGFDHYMVTYKPGKNTDPENDPHMSDSIGNRALEFLDHRSQKPFFLFLSFNAIHDPLMERSDSIARWLDKRGSDVPQNNATIGAMMNRMDHNIGRMLKAIDDRGLKGNTIVVFFSDNGGLESDAVQTPLRRGKGWLYEGGIRVPMIIRWPGVVIPGSESNQPVSSIDFLPTFADVLQSPPQTADVDGISLLPHLRTGEPLSARNLYWHYPHYHWALGTVPNGAIRSGQWKLVEWYKESLEGDTQSGFELYNISRDIGETVDLSKLYPQKTQELARQLDQWRISVNAQMPELKAVDSRKNRKKN